VKKVALLTLSSLFFYSLLRDMNLLKTLILCGAIVVAFVVSKAPSKYIVAAKYPLICLCFALSVLLVLYPELRTKQLIRAAGMFVTFFSLSLYVATIDEKGKGLYKEILALSLLLISTAVNLVMTRSMELFLPLSITILLFLFILNRMKLIPLVGAYVVGMLIFLYIKKVSLFAPGLELSQIERYLVLSTAFLLLLATFIGFVRQPGSLWTIAFFGLLCASIDILVSMGFSLKGCLLHQPLAALLILAPLVGITLQGEGGS
jgi:hypothetical protein